MEVFSTPSRTALPWATNVFTVGVLVAATWWSADHRPAKANAQQTVSGLVTGSAQAVNRQDGQAQASAQIGPKQMGLPGQAAHSTAAPDSAAAVLAGHWAEAKVPRSSVQPVSFVGERATATSAR